MLPFHDDQKISQTSSFDRLSNDDKLIHGKVSGEDMD
jgi:hypothetical protein